MKLINTHLITQKQRKFTLLYNYMDTLIDQLLVIFNRLLDSLFNSLLVIIIKFLRRNYDGGRHRKSLNWRKKDV